MVAAVLWLLRLITILTVVSITAVGISVALVASVRAAEPTVSKGEAELARRMIELGGKPSQIVYWSLGGPEKSDADAESRRDLSHALLQH